ncbi:TPA: hypothetical protein DEP21_01915 [Patescibacteria group bacterium]|nr:hypothetical protein [Candidatus Gracilibacteria bacterium]
MKLLKDPQKKDFIWSMIWLFVLILCIILVCISYYTNIFILIWMRKILVGIGVFAFLAIYYISHPDTEQVSRDPESEEYW